MALACALFASLFPRVSQAQLSPPAAGGVVEVDRLLQRLAEPRRLLVIGAHPDDEDTEILALAAIRHGARAAYLSLSRGEGGQNLIGPELGEELGLLRSQELLAARGTDGAEQYFTRAFDFGFSRSLEETSRFWPPDSLLKDAVRVVRRFRPHVIVSVFTGTPRDGHGQHQMAGVIARRVFQGAGDAAAFPELQRDEGLAPWTPLRLYRSTRFDSAATQITLQTGLLDERSGRTVHQIAMASRSLHRSQDMGQLQRIGPQTATLQLLAENDGAGVSESADGGGVFAGIPLAETWLTRFADSLRGQLSVPRLPAAAVAIAGALRRLGEAPEDTEARNVLERALAAAAGIVVDARADAAELVPGQHARVVIEVFNGGADDVLFESATLSAPAGWRVVPGAGETRSLQAGQMVAESVAVTVAADARPTQPYFLERPRIGALYDWSVAEPALRGQPFGPAPLTARVMLRVAGAQVALSREVTYRLNDQARGEVRRLVRVVPPLEVRLQPRTVVWPADAPATRPFTVSLTSRVAGSHTADVRLEVDGWPAPPVAQVSFDAAGQERTVTFQLRRPAAVRDASVTVRAVARLADGRESDQAVDLIEYPHVRHTPRVVPATAAVRVAPLLLPAVSRVGYVRGAADLVPEALGQVGLPLELLGPERLARGDLSPFDAIIIGARAYETDTALVRHNSRLLQYVERGGTLIVQYQQYAYVTGKFAPYEITIARPHDRVTDETAPVRVLEPEHSAFTRPNRIGAADWDGWPQERGLYFARSWDAAFRPLLETSDPGMPPLQGGLLVARYGRGTYVYTGLAFFRALPAGVVGAYRVFLNLLALGQR
ncbi:MAG TPA: PIG-L family deacetylase [Gemmatimonadales bacterium]|nr:PIG-L family deacetylase [Gemmatimonadales bacterium]